MNVSEHIVSMKHIFEHDCCFPGRLQILHGWNFFVLLPFNIAQMARRKRCTSIKCLFITVFIIVISLMWMTFSGDLIFSPCLGMYLNDGPPSTVTLFNDCEGLSKVKLDSAQVYPLYDAYYIKVFEVMCSSSFVRVCVLKQLSMNTSIVHPAPAEESPLCNDTLKWPKCLPSSCLRDDYPSLANWLGLSLLKPNQSNMYLFLDTKTKTEYWKNLTDQPLQLREVWLDMIPECRYLVPLGLVSLVITGLVSVVYGTIFCALYTCFGLLLCRRWVYTYTI